jgi:hypothetical protein
MVIIVEMLWHGIRDLWRRKRRTRIHLTVLMTWMTSSKVDGLAERRADVLLWIRLIRRFHSLSLKVACTAISLI